MAQLQDYKTSMSVFLIYYIYLKGMIPFMKSKYSRYRPRFTVAPIPPTSPPPAFRNELITAFKQGRSTIIVHRSENLSIRKTMWVIKFAGLFRRTDPQTERVLEEQSLLIKDTSSDLEFMVISRD